MAKALPVPESKVPSWQLVHEHEYDAAVAHLETLPRLERVLVMLTYYIACDPTMFPLVENSDIEGMRVAPSEAIGPAPGLAIYYTIEEWHSIVRLWYVASEDDAPEQD